MSLKKVFYALGVDFDGMRFRMQKGGYVYPVVKPDATVYARTSNGTISSANMGNIVTNTGATGTITLTLPSAADYRGYAIKFQVTAAQAIRIDPDGSERIYLGGSGGAGKYLQIAGTIGNYADLYSDGTNWLVISYSGALTKEA